MQERKNLPIQRRPPPPRRPKATNSGSRYHTMPSDILVVWLIVYIRSLSISLSHNSWCTDYGPHP